MRTRMWIGIGTVALLAVGGGGYMIAQSKAAQSKDGKDKGPPALEFVAQELAQARMEPMPVLIEFSGALQAPKTATVRSKAQVTLLRLDAAEGGRVKAGQVIGQLDLSAMNASLADKQATLGSAQAQAQLAKRTLESNQRLADQQFISPNALENQRAALQAAQASVQSAQAQLRQTQVSMRDAQLTAPITGVVSKRHALPGEKLTPDQAVITIVDLQRLELAGSVAAHEVSRLAAGQPVKVQVEGMPEPVAGKIERIAPAAEAGTRSIGVYVVIENPSETLRAGQYATASTVVGDATARLTVPAASLVSLSGQEYVWALENDKLVRRLVTTGRRDASSGRVEVLTGLAAASNVLAVRFDNLKDGAAAKIVAAKTAPPAKPPAQPVVAKQ